MAHVVAVDLGGTKVVAGVVDRRGTIRDRLIEPLGLDPVEQIVRMVRSLDESPKAVGVAVPGLVRRDGTVWAPNLPGGQLVRGAHGLSGCAGWMVVTDETNENTARAGSLEAIAAGPALARHKDLGHAGQILGLAVANLISLFDPEVIVLTGEVTNSADKVLDILVQNARRRAQPLSAPQVAIVVSALQSDANLLGVARLAMA